MVYRYVNIISMFNFNRMVPNRTLEKTIATASFVVAVVLAFLGLAIAEDHQIASNNLFVVAQFLTLTATLLGIDYKFTHNGTNIGTPTAGTP